MDALQKAYPLKSGTRDGVMLTCLALIGAAGAVSQVIGDEGITVVKGSGTGEYILTFTPRNLKQFERTVWMVLPHSPALTISSVVSTSAGTFLAEGEATVTTIKADGTAVMPADGDILIVWLKTTSSGTRQ